MGKESKSKAPKDERPGACTPPCDDPNVIVDRTLVFLPLTSAFGAPAIPFPLSIGRSTHITCVYANKRRMIPRSVGTYTPFSSEPSSPSPLAPPRRPPLPVGPHAPPPSAPERPQSEAVKMLKEIQFFWSLLSNIPERVRNLLTPRQAALVTGVFALIAGLLRW
jgi:hypothetical protein